MGFASLGVLESVVRATIGLRWEDVGELSDILALVDADISQAIQVSDEIGILCILRTYMTESELQGRDRRGSYWRSRKCASNSYRTTGCREGQLP
jgi:hypothetical protein